MTRSSRRSCLALTALASRRARACRGLRRTPRRRGSPSMRSVDGRSRSTRKRHEAHALRSTIAFLADLDDSCSPACRSAACLRRERVRPSARDRQERAVHRRGRHGSDPGAARRQSHRAARSTTLLARDSAGRTRQERKDGGRAGVYIFDPMEGRSFVLNERTRTATRIPRIPRRADRRPSRRFRPSRRSPPAPPAPPAAARSRTSRCSPAASSCVATAASRAARNDDVHVEVIRIGRGDRRRPPCRRCRRCRRSRCRSAARQGRDEDRSARASSTASRPKARRRRTRFPRARSATRRPIVITSERWFSPELHIVVFAKTSDPRAGETIYRLTNVKRGEPPAELFKIPADYRTRGDAPPRRRRRTRVKCAR